ncbi:NAD(P)H-dependent glycerol-3-phosphate dehydrogenase [Hahella sp. NBU794]|uniref:NAD(P)H-dependent glycerol-3-phosphate dehydrogenase n=1 Tax=Hahella sp. NBU794 TaxID=3422590 RepID=UPI003D6EDF69
MEKSQKVAVLGGGSFGTALANIAAGNGYPTVLWMRDQERAAEMSKTGENARYLPGVKLNENLICTSDMEEAVANSDLVLVSVPSKSFGDVVRDAKQYAKPGQFWLSTTKGIDEKGFKLMSDILREELTEQEIGVISGPNLAKEIGQESLAATVVASNSEPVRTLVQDVLSCRYFRVYANVDMYGVELGGALKNIYAIIAGLASALELGENTKAMLITRSLAEMSRFAVFMGANPMTFLGLAGVGDLVVTCSSPLSRNYRVGFALGKGEKLEDTVAALGEVAEGVNTTRLVRDKSRELGVEMPLVEGLYKIIYEHFPIKQVVSQLMLREQNSDVEFVLPRSEAN